LLPGKGLTPWIGVKNISVADVQSSLELKSVAKKRRKAMCLASFDNEGWQQKDQ